MPPLSTNSQFYIFFIAVIINLKNNYLASLL
ncbi:hypothetical protein SAMN04489724_4025 [Algoriphagus locisalis]|uniref:Uncharacterized protein n=1 Tax=Algoriphagus locisalis TaxID=305507 RepID=A0A1I7DFZ3_9BACT|nr:hypothetical protein SAMN04489724_4025 [Algoriphagus locisalis]